MHILVSKPETITLTHLESEEIEVEYQNEALHFGAISMFVASLGGCTFAVLNTYAHRLDVTTENIRITLDWGYQQQPTRISHINMQIVWPELPDKRIKSVKRATHKCTVHSTIHHCVDIQTEVTNQG